jgi:hypothetical protein
VYCIGTVLKTFHPGEIRTHDLLLRWRRRWPVGMYTTPPGPADAWFIDSCDSYEIELRSIETLNACLNTFLDKNVGRGNTVSKSTYLGSVFLPTSRLPTVTISTFKMYLDLQIIDHQNFYVHSNCIHSDNRPSKWRLSKCRHHKWTYPNLLRAGGDMWIRHFQLLM